jgi:RND family efflux transporter MFP subunit
MTGVLVPESEVVLVATSFARLKTLTLEVGDHVDAGALIAEMDVRTEQSELAVATAAWQASKAELERLELELEQAKAKREDVEQLEDFVSRAELREQRFAEKLADARTRSAGASMSQQRSKMQEASARIAEAELRAPFSGSIADRHVDPGATLGSGDPVVRLISDARVLRFAVPESLASRLRIGAPLRVEFPELAPLDSEVVAIDSELASLDAEVVAIAPEIQVGTRLIFAEARLVGGADQRVGSVARVFFR